MLTLLSDQFDEYIFSYDEFAAASDYNVTVFFTGELGRTHNITVARKYVPTYNRHHILHFSREIEIITVLKRCTVFIKRVEQG